MTTMSKETLKNIEEEEGQWKNLPTDILALILRHFHTKLDLCRFRSICKSWRCFANQIQPHLLFPLTLPPLQPGSNSSSLYPRLLYIFSPNSTLLHHHNRHNNINGCNDFWFTKIRDDIDYHNNNRLVLLNPFINSRLCGRFPIDPSRNVLNLLGFRYHEVGRWYRCSKIFDRHGDYNNEFEFSPSSTLLEKVVVLIKERISVLGFNGYHEIVLWNYGDQDWKIIDTGNEESKDAFVDIICYDGKFYAVDHTGRLVMINPTDVEVVEVISSSEEFNDNSHYTYLVESDFRLYMVIKMLYRSLSNDEVENWDEVNSDDDDIFSIPKPLGFKVYVLNEREKSWERVYSLGNKVFFVGAYGGATAFSVSAADLGLSKGNYIYFAAFIKEADIYSLEDEAIVTCDLTVDQRARFFCLPTSWFVQNEGSKFVQNEGSKFVQNEDYPEGESSGGATLRHGYEEVARVEL